MRTNCAIALTAVALGGAAWLSQDASAQERTARQDRSTRESQGDYAAYKLLQRAGELRREVCVKAGRSPRAA